jgi:hypothetical protein
MPLAALPSAWRRLCENLEKTNLKLRNRSRKITPARRNAMDKKGRPTPTAPVASERNFRILSRLPYID